MKKIEIFYQIKMLEKTILQYVLKVNGVINVDMPKIIPTSTQMEILDYIFEHSEEEIYQKDLENVLALKRATISGVLQTMEKNKLIERVVDEDDTRTKKIILNQSAKEIYLKNHKVMETLEQKALNNISKDDLDVFLRVIETMRKNINYK